MPLSSSITRCASGFLSSSVYIFFLSTFELFFAFIEIIPGEKQILTRLLMIYMQLKIDFLIFIAVALRKKSSEED